jgi:hypothetical protein
LSAPDGWFFQEQRTVIWYGFKFHRADKTAIEVLSDIRRHLLCEFRVLQVAKVRIEIIAPLVAPHIFAYAAPAK